MYTHLVFSLLQSNSWLYIVGNEWSNSCHHFDSHSSYWVWITLMVRLHSWCNYKPYYWTKLLHQAESIGYLLVGGSGMLWEQGVSQFELWTGQTDSIILDTWDNNIMTYDNFLAAKTIIRVGGHCKKSRSLFETVVKDTPKKIAKPKSQQVTQL